MSRSLGRIEVSSSGTHYNHGATKQLSSSHYLSTKCNLVSLRSRLDTKSERHLTSATTKTSTPVSLFKFGGSKSKTTDAVSYICIDCGYIYSGSDFSTEPRSYKCPACQSPKNRFKVYKGDDVGRRPNNSNGACLKRLKERKW